MEVSPVEKSKRFPIDVKTVFVAILSHSHRQIVLSLLSLGKLADIRCQATSNKFVGKLGRKVISKESFKSGARAQVWQ